VDASAKEGIVNNFEFNHLNNTASKSYCLVVSALAPYKRVDLAVAACSRLGIELRIVGEGSERSRLEGLAAKGGSHCRFLGRVSAEKLRHLYADAKLFLQPGLEDFGISSVEALASGTPVVALGHGGIRDIVEDGHHGLLYSSKNDAEALANAIDKAAKIRFNPLELQSRAQFFSAPRFSERFAASIARWIAQSEAVTR
jgi:glycosyltransferase involved in cell wall biosynthesis